MSSPTFAGTGGTRTYGAALAVLEAGGSGGLIVASTPGHGVPRGFDATGDPEDVRIYPNIDNGAEYCGSGWHVVSLNNFGFVEEFGDKETLFDYLAATEISFELDGVPLETRRSAIKALPAFDEQHGFQFGVGSLLPPGTLTVGTHELQTSASDPIFGEETWILEFTVLPC